MSMRQAVAHQPVRSGASPSCSRAGTTPRQWAASLQGAARGYMEGDEGDEAAEAASPARQPPAQQQQQGRSQGGPYGAAVRLTEEQPRPRRSWLPGRGSPEARPARPTGACPALPRLGNHGLAVDWPSLVVSLDNLGKLGCSDWIRMTLLEKCKSNQVCLPPVSLLTPALRTVYFSSSNV